MKSITNITYPAFAVFAVVCFAVAPQARAVCQQGCDVNKFNTVLGDDALISNTTGNGNTATGSHALLANTTGSFNTANGNSTLLYNTTGYDNTAIGWAALNANSTGHSNTATGYEALVNNTTGNGNTANGDQALLSNTTGNENTANGYFALGFNTTGSFNTAHGDQALLNNTTGNSNTANGANALYFNTTGYYNTANGFSALYNNTTGANNLANGYNALLSNTIGSTNTANGDGALLSNTTGNSNTADGYLALLNNTTGGSNIALGYLAGQNLTAGNNNIDIGNAGVAGESSTIRIGTRPAQRNTFIAGISGVTVASGVGVIINTQGKLGTVVSSARCKDNIQPMDKASETLLDLQPVTFRYKKDLDPAGIAQFGLVAEDVEKVNPDLVARDEQGKPYSVRYEAVNAMLLNEFLKEHRKVEQQRKDFEAALARQQKQIEQLTAGLQKVNAQLEVNKLVAQKVTNNQ